MAGQGDEVVLFLAGDVMTGRGVDQILPSPGSPRLWEPSVTDARTYVELAEKVNGHIARPVDHWWPWGEALPLLDAVAPDLRLINVETSITRNDGYARDKSVHYRMHPDNIPCLAAARPDVCVLANNHVLDFGTAGLVDTLDTLDAAGLRAVGAGRDGHAAWRPARLTVGRHRVLVFAAATTSSGTPSTWAAAADRPGVAVITDASAAAAAPFAERIRRVREPDDLVVVSVHWGSNWGYEVPPGDVQFAHYLIDAGVDVVYGHSSHHPRPIEVYRGRLVLYGCGDLIDDYEGIGGYERYRDELRLLYLATLDGGTGELLGLRMVPMRVAQMRLRRAGPGDARWLHDNLNEISGRFGVRIESEPDGILAVRPDVMHSTG
jgi:poly-gamma-glutamate capsule biosynthesis protein CapA/YwtB (metallophosphatase superfamily)